MEIDLWLSKGDNARLDLVASKEAFWPSFIKRIDSVNYFVTELSFRVMMNSPDLDLWWPIC